MNIIALRKEENQEINSEVIEETNILNETIIDLKEKNYAN